MLRTDFSNDSAWKSVCNAIRRPQGLLGVRANVECISDPAFQGLTAEQLLAQASEFDNREFIFIFDSFTLTHPENPILVLDLFEESGQTFRVIPSEMWSVESNLSTSNMDFSEFAESAGDDGIFRGFPGNDE